MSVKRPWDTRKCRRRNRYGCTKDSGPSFFKISKIYYQVSFLITNILVTDKVRYYFQSFAWSTLLTRKMSLREEWKTVYNYFFSRALCNFLCNRSIRSRGSNLYLYKSLYKKCRGFRSMSQKSRYDIAFYLSLLTGLRMWLYCTPCPPSTSTPRLWL